jgi:hypothetical protein
MSRTRKMLAAVVGMMAVAGIAFGAWSALQGASGQGEGKVITQQISPMVSLAVDWCSTDTGTMGQVDPTVPNSGDLCADVTNNGTVAETITSLTTGTITPDASHSTCPGTDFTFIPSSAVIGPVGTSKAWPVGLNAGKFLGNVNAVSNLPSSCSGATLTFNFTGTTSP